MRDTIRDETFLDYIRDQPCAVCTAPAPSDPHHLDSGVMGSKGDDWTCVPLCRTHHREYHDHGEAHMRRQHGVDLWKQSHHLLRRYAARRLETQAA